MKPFFAKHAGELPAPTLEEFLRAVSLVSSRAFLVDEHHGDSMVPVADMYVSLSRSLSLSLSLCVCVCVLVLCLCLCLCLFVCVCCFVCAAVAVGVLVCVLDELLRAVSLVSSRAFLVDELHGDSMVPVADMYVCMCVCVCLCV